MTALPPNLAGWETELAWIDPTLAPALAAMLPRLSLAIGPLRRSEREQGEPDGYGRLARRGPFDRLLASQWALLDEVPEDFLRRASSNELLFFELARAEPHGSQRSIALFDAGPFSLGAPRIAHVALLVVLARRAAEVGVPFFWGTLREPTLLPFVGGASVRRLLDVRTALRASDVTWQGWRDALARHDAPERGRAAREADDVFVVGDALAVEEARARLGVGVASAIVGDAILGPRDELEVTVRRSARESKRVTLPLPDPPSRVRLLRDPFRVVQQPVVALRPPTDRTAAWTARLGAAIVPEAGLSFSRDGRKVLVRTRTGVAALVVPEAGQSGRVLGRYERPEERTVAVGMAGRRVVTVTQGAYAPLGRGTLTLHEVRGGARDLDTAELHTSGPLLFSRRLCSIALGLTSPPSRAPDVVVRTPTGLWRWSELAAKIAPEFHAAHAVVPIGSGPQGLALVARLHEGGGADGYAYERPLEGERDAFLARAPDDSVVIVREGSASASTAGRARAIHAAPPLPAFDAVLEVTEHDGIATIVTEGLAGPTLASRLDALRTRGEARLPVAVAVTLARQLAEALASLAVAGLAPHGGLRLTRIHLSADGAVRLRHALEFPADATDPMPASEDVAYLAPEQVQGRAADARADVYMVGLVLHELLTGRHATEQSGLFARLGAIAAGRLVDVAVRAQSLPPELHAIVRTATAFEPSARFASSAALADALGTFLGTRGASSSEVIAALALDESPTTRRVLSTPWRMTRVRGPGASDVRELAPALRVVTGGTPGGQGLLGFVEPDRVRIVAPSAPDREWICGIPLGSSVVGVCDHEVVLVRRADGLEVRNAQGALAAFAVPADAEVVMAPGWPHVATLSPRGEVQVILVTERRVALVVGAPT